MSTALRKPLPKEWAERFALIPGYDPEATAGDCEFRPHVAARVIDFFEKEMTHIEGAGIAGTPLKLEPWQEAIVGAAFGYFRPNGTRRYREVFQLVPRKNGKSTLLGALINLVAIADNEPGAQIYSAAADREQAALVYRQTKGMLLNNSKYAPPVTKIYATYKSIEYPKGVIYKALSAEADTKHGFNSHFIVVDELHAQPNSDLVDVLVTSTGSRKQPLVWFITTADYRRESVCNTKYDYACKVRDGIVDDPGFLPVIYEASRDDDWTSPEVWAKANPNLGVSVSLEYIERECKRAQEEPSYENTFKRLHLNIQTEQDERWIPIQLWDDCKIEAAPEGLEGRQCYAGLDLSSTTDVTAFVLAFPGNPVGVLPFFWISEDKMRQREKRDRLPWSTWTRQGHVTVCEGNTIDYDVVRRDINAINEKFQVLKILVDRWNALQLSTQLMGDGFEVELFGQGFASMSAPAKHLEKLIAEKTLAHIGNPVMRNMMASVAIERDAADNIKPSKKKSTDRIDGVVALVMAIAPMMSHESSTSVYESRGMIEL